MKLLPSKKNNIKKAIKSFVFFYIIYVLFSFCLGKKQIYSYKKKDKHF